MELGISFFYIESNAVCLVFFLLLLIRSIRGVDRQEKQRVFEAIVICHIFYFVDDIIWAMLLSGIIEPSQPMVIITCIMSHLIVSLLSCFWFIYVELMLHTKFVTSRKKRGYTLIPVIASTFIMTMLFFFESKHLINDDYSNTTLYDILFLIVPVTYIISASFRALVGACHKSKYAIRYQLIVFAAYPIAVAVLGIFQMIWLTIPIFCFGCTITMFYVHLMSLDNLVSQDPLTKLNNRAQLRRYIATEADDNKSYFIMMIDLNSFKQINDKYGHVEGDFAIRRTASALSLACHDCPLKSFVARYGGDEFIIVVKTDNEEDIIELKARINKCMRRANIKAETEYPLTASIGYARYDGNTANFQNALADADAELYKEKQRIKASK